MGQFEMRNEAHPLHFPLHWSSGHLEIVCKCVERPGGLELSAVRKLYVSLTNQAEGRFARAMRAWPLHRPGG
jgi:hypothetical protein